MQMGNETRRDTWGPLRWIVTCLDRGAIWGSYEVQREPYGIVHYRLTVYPPGTDALTRRWIRLRDAWCGPGLVCAAGVVFVLILLLPPLAAATVAVYIAVWTVISRRVGGARRSTRRLYAMDFGEGATPDEVEHCAHVRQAASVLVDADRSLREGLITSMEHKIIWARIFEDIGQREPESTMPRSAVDRSAAHLGDA
jgi:hypothetical protein